MIVVERRHELRLARGLVGARHLAEGEILGEAPRRELVHRAREHGEKGPPGGVRAARAALRTL